MKNYENANSSLITIYILHSLKFIHQTDIVKNISNKDINFLIKSKEPTGFLKFATYTKYPDTESTSLLQVTQEENGEEINNDILDDVLTYETNQSMFYIWMKNSGENYIDCISNANVLYSFYSLNRSLPDLCEAFNKFIGENNFTNPEDSCYRYYRSPYSFTYTITRSYADGGAVCLQKSMKNVLYYLLKTQKNDGGWGNELDTGLATASLLNLNYDGKELHKAIQKILFDQNVDGSWNKNVFFTMFPPPKYGRYYFSDTLTTAINLEALGKYLNKFEN